jgi:adenosylmethionine-8-amino-7-oxononanoate transaminase
MEDLAYDKLLQKNSEFLWNPFTQMSQYIEDMPIIIESGDGVTLTDVNGKMYFDGNSSLWLNVHGHRQDELGQAIKDQLDKIAHSTLLGMSNIPAILLAEQLVKITPTGLNKVFYSDSGATAVEIAIKMAFAYWRRVGHSERTQFLAFENGYHGDTVAAMSVGGINLYRTEFGPLLFDSIHTPFPYVYGFPGPAEECISYCLKELDTILKSKGDNIAAFVIEPLVQGAAGMHMMPEGFLSEVTRMARDRGILIIADEVATGFCRTGETFAVNHEGVLPDIMAVGKGLTGGYLPLAATLVTDEIYDAFLGTPNEQKTFYHGHSFTGNQLGCAVALKNLELIERADLTSKVAEKSHFLACLLNRITGLEHVGEVRQKGFMVGIELALDKAVKQPFPSDELMGYKVCLACRELGLITRPLGDVVVFLPPLTSTNNDLSEMVNILAEAITKATQ